MTAGPDPAAPAVPRRLLIRGVRLLDVERADILVDGPTIRAVGPDLAADGAEIVDGNGLLALPGLINAHFHSPTNLLKGTLDGLPLELFMLHEVPPFAGWPPPPREIYVRTLLGAVEMLKLGITAVQDDAFFVPRPDPASIDALMSAYAHSGLRATVALDQPNVVEYRKYPFLEALLPSDLRARMDAAPLPTAAELATLYGHLLQTWHGAGDGRLRGAVSCSAPHRVTTDHLAWLAATSRDLGLPFYVHMLETRLQRVFGQEVLGTSLVRFMADRDLLDARTNLVHGIWIDAEDIAAIAAAGAVVVHNPVCNLRLGSGIMPFRRLREHDIPIALGTDEALADDAVNLWTSIKLTGLVHNLSDPDFTRWPRASEVLDCVFAGGARAMGLADRLGRIAPGYAADLALVDLDTLAFTPLNDVERQLVYCENGSSVVMTIVNGRIVAREGRVLTVDEAALREEAREIARARAPMRAAMRADAVRLEPYYREMYRRACTVGVGFSRWAADTGG
jgi:5-methylthioadenosine/S-adenosylhomocysteine deaminase